MGRGGMGVTKGHEETFWEGKDMFTILIVVRASQHYMYISKLIKLGGLLLLFALPLNVFL